MSSYYYQEKINALFTVLHSNDTSKEARSVRCTANAYRFLGKIPCTPPQLACKVCCTPAYSKSRKLQGHSASDGRAPRSGSWMAFAGMQWDAVLPVISTTWASKLQQFWQLWNWKVQGLWLKTTGGNEWQWIPLSLSCWHLWRKINMCICQLFKK